jgi:hypothetical protein
MAHAMTSSWMLLDGRADAEENVTATVHNNAVTRTMTAELSVQIANNSSWAYFELNMICVRNLQLYE